MQPFISVVAFLAAGLAMFFYRENIAALVTSTPAWVGVTIAIIYLGWLYWSLYRRWLYNLTEKVIAAIPRQDRNAPCACGSGRKHKLCCTPESFLDPHNYHKTLLILSAAKLHSPLAARLYSPLNAILIRMVRKMNNTTS